MRKIAILGVSAVVLLVVGCGGGATHSLNGQVTLISSSMVVGQQDGAPACKGAGGYADIIGGASVVMENGSGKQLAQTTLGLGEPTSDDSICVFPFAIAELPESNDYVLRISDRPPVPYTLDELRADNFTIRLRLDERES
ncbi:MAG: hypothetical protein IT337_05025 [Thermomicrobiales bacterium]|nr:hypothetical protein [Thermomicrobiales bacterium]